jgi:hypothetical protein
MSEPQNCVRNFVPRVRFNLSPRGPAKSRCHDLPDDCTSGVELGRGGGRH